MSRVDPLIQHGQPSNRPCLRDSPNHSTSRTRVRSHAQISCKWQQTRTDGPIELSPSRSPHSTTTAQPRPSIPTVVSRMLALEGQCRFALVPRGRAKELSIGSFAPSMLFTLCFTCDSLLRSSHILSRRKAIDSSSTMSWSQKLVMRNTSHSSRMCSSPDRHPNTTRKCTYLCVCLFSSPANHKSIILDWTAASRRPLLTCDITCRHLCRGYTSTEREESAIKDFATQSSTGLEAMPSRSLVSRTNNSFVFDAASGHAFLVPSVRSRPASNEPTLTPFSVPRMRSGKTM